MKKFTQRELILSVQKKFDLRKDTSEQLVNTVYDDIRKALESGRTVLIPGVGTITPELRPPRVVKGLGKVFKVPELIKLRFRQSTKFQPIKTKKKVKMIKKGGGLSSLSNDLNDE